MLRVPSVGVLCIGARSVDGSDAMTRAPFLIVHVRAPTRSTPAVTAAQGGAECAEAETYAPSLGRRSLAGDVRPTQSRLRSSMPLHHPGHLTLRCMEVSLWSAAHSVLRKILGAAGHRATHATDAVSGADEG